MNFAQFSIGEGEFILAKDLRGDNQVIARIVDIDEKKRMASNLIQ